MHDGAHLVLPPAGLEQDFLADPALRELPVPTAQQQALYLIYKEGLPNAVKHAKRATEVRVRLHAGNHQLELHISDNGHGLGNMPVHAQALGGTVSYGAAPAGFVVKSLLSLT